MGPLEDRTLRTASTALSGLSKRQQVIADNLANVDTPGFSASEVSFESTLQGALNRQADGTAGRARIQLVQTNTRHLGGITASGSLGSPIQVVSTAGRGPTRYDGNNVDVDKEMAKLAETQIAYNAVAQVTATKLSGLRNAINEGRR